MIEQRQQTIAQLQAEHDRLASDISSIEAARADLASVEADRSEIERRRFELAGLQRDIVGAA